jgi:N-sulfoglucosamine sulfohydrolase
MISRKTFLKQIGYGSAAVVFPKINLISNETHTKKPNILWLSCEDISPNLGCYGDPFAKTPNLDQMATEGILYKNAFTAAPVCAPNRSSIITGVYQTTLGTHHMRSGGEGTERSIKPVLPKSIKCFPEYLRQAGYYCTNNYKEDYQFNVPRTTWDESSKNAHWKNRPNKNTPFFAVFNYTATHEGSVRLDDKRHAEVTKRLLPSQRQNPDELATLPPYYPDTNVTRKQWAKYYELITAMDYWIADLLQELEEAGEIKNTIIFFWSDHGAGITRAKRWLYDSGTHIPLIVKIPKKYLDSGVSKPGTLTDRLVSSVDFAATVLNLLGLKIPEYIQGQPFLGKNVPAEREYVFGARDRMDERYDAIRMLRNKKYKYIKNYEPDREYYQYMNTAEKDPILMELRRLNKNGKLKSTAAQFMKDQKPVEELYDIKNDPHEVNNLAENPDYKTILNQLREKHVEWLIATKDLGLIPEPEMVRLEKEFGNRYEIIRNIGGKEFLKKLQSLASIAGCPQPSDRSNFVDTLNNKNASIRYWAVIGIGNLKPVQSQDSEVLIDMLCDSSAEVRIAAAFSLCRINKVTNALPVLIKELQSEEEWVRLHAAIALDRIGEKARPAIPVLKQALKDTHNKYVVRVANHAINVLLGTNNQVR